VMNSSGIGIRTTAKSISRQGREATGVRLMSLEDGGEIVAFTVIEAEDDDE
jgi:DNA gyrase subunit A